MESHNEADEAHDGEAPDRSAPHRRDSLDGIIASADDLSEGDFAGAITVIERGVNARLPAAQMRLLEECVSKATKISRATLRAFTDQNLNTVDGFGHIGTVVRAAEYVLNRLEADYPVVVTTEGSLHAYDANEGCFVRATEDEVLQVIDESIGSLPRWGRPLEQREVRQKLAAVTAVDGFFLDQSPGLCVANCFLSYDAQSGRVDQLEHSQHLKARFRCEVVYDGAADCPYFRTRLAAVLTTENKRRAFQEFLGCMLLGIAPPKDAVRKMLVFFGATRSGKSTLIDLCREILPDPVIGSVKPTTWNSEFSRARLAGLVLNYCTELGASLGFSEDLKQITAWETVTGRFRYGNEHELRPRVYNVFATNAPPRIRDASGAMDRRIMVLHFDQSLTNEEVDPDFLENVKAELPGVLAWALTGAERAMTQGHFTVPEGHAEALVRMKYGEDPVAYFVHSQLVEAPGCRTFSSDIQAALGRFCRDGGMDIPSMPGAMRRLSGMVEVAFGAKRSRSNNAPHWTGFRLNAGAEPAAAESDPILEL